MKELVIRIGQARDMLILCAEGGKLQETAKIRDSGDILDISIFYYINVGKEIHIHCLSHVALPIIR